MPTINNTRRILILTFALLLLLGAAAGCRKASPTPMPSPTHSPTAAVTPSPSPVVAEMTPTPTNATPYNTGLPDEETTHEPDAAAASLRTGDTEQTAAMAQTVLSVPEVQSGVVVTLNHLTLVGITYSEQFRGAASAGAQMKVYNALLPVAGTQTNILITDEPGMVAALSTLAARIDSGERTGDILTAFDDLVREILS